MSAAGYSQLGKVISLSSFGFPRSAGQAERQGAAEKTAAAICADRCRVSPVYTLKEGNKENVFRHLTNSRIGHNSEDLSNCYRQKNH
jgi:hypothetical protein